MNTALRGLDFRSFEAFRAVAELRSFTKAGRRVGLTQSAVTREVQRLEGAVGAELLHRTTRSVRLTEAGEVFLGVAARMVREFDDRMERFAEEFLNQPPRVAIGLSHGIAYSHLPGLLAHFRRTHPEAAVTVSYASAAELREALLDHRLDLAVFTQPAAAPTKLERLHSFRDEFVIVEPSGESCGDGGPWLVPSWGTTSGALVRDWVRRIDTAFAPPTELPSFDLIINMVALGLGRGIVPRRALRLYGRRLPVNEIEPAEPMVRTIGVYARAGEHPSPAAQGLTKSILFGWKSPSR